MATIPAQFQALNLLGRGGMGEVWQVRGETGDETLALKICLDPDEAGRLLFRQEFWAMTSLRHPTLVPALAQGETPDGFPYFTMPVISGADASGVLEEETVRAFLPALLSGLDFLHQRGFVHGDLKPENLRLLSDGGIRLMDLGLLQRVGRPGKISGTLLYLAPEVILGRALDGRTDLYALGAVLYELLTGTAPFTDERRDDLLRAHVSRAPIPMREKNPAISVEMDRVVQCLLAKNPADRFDNGPGVLKALGMEAADDEAASLWPPPLVGREGVQGALETWVLGAPSVPAIKGLKGLPGMGRTRLLEELQAFAQLEGKVCLLAAAQGRDASPYRGLADAVKQLWARVEPAKRDRLAPFLSTVMPNLAERAAPALEGSAERTRFFDAIATLAQSVDGEILWCIDNFDKLDADSADLLLFLVKRGEARGWRWLLSAETFDEHFLSPCDVVSLEPLSAPQVEAVLQGMLGTAVPPNVLAETVRLTEGIPASIQTLLQHWVQQGILKKRRGEWGVPRPEALAVNVQELGISGLPLLSLPDEAQTLLLDAALLGERGLISDWLAFSGVPEHRLFEMMSVFQGLGILETSGGNYGFVRPAQAAGVIAKLDSQTQILQQHRVAEFLSGRYPLPACIARRDLGRILEVAHHWRNANALTQALPWVEAATRLCLSRGTTTTVVHLVNGMLQSSEISSTFFQTLAGLEVYILRHQGQLDEAIARYTGGLLDQFLARGGREAAEHLITYSTMLQQKARYKDAEAASKEGVERARALEDWSTVVRGLFGLGRIHYFGGASDLALARLEEAIALARQHQLTASLPPMLSLAGYILSEKDKAKMGEAMALLTEGLKQARDDENLMDAAEALNNLGNVLMANGRFSAAKRYFDEYLELCVRMAFPGEETFAHLNTAAVALELGHFGDAGYHLDAALNLCRNTGRRFPEAFALVLQGSLKVYVGETDAGLALIQSGIDIAREISNRYLENQALPYLAEAAFLSGQIEWAGALVAQIEGDKEDSSHGDHGTRLGRIKAGLKAFHQPETYLREQEEHMNTSVRVYGVTAHCLRWAGCGALRLGQAARAERFLRQAAQLAEAEELRALTIELDLLQALAAEEQGAFGRAGACLERAIRGGQGAGIPDIAEWVKLLRAQLPGGPLEQAFAVQAGLLHRHSALPPEARENALQLMCRDRMLLQEATVDMSVRATQIASILLELSACPNSQDLIQRSLGAVRRALGGAGAQLLTFKDSTVHQRHQDGEMSDTLQQAMLRLAQEASASGVECLTGVKESDEADESFLVGVPLGSPNEVYVWVVHVPSRSGPDVQAAMKTLHYVGQQTLNLLAILANALPVSPPSKGAALVLEGAKAALSKPNAALRVAALAEESLKIFDANRLLWLVAAGRGMRCELAFDKSGAPINPEWQIFTKGVARSAFREQTPQFFDATVDEVRHKRASVRALDLHYVLAAPVCRGDELLGVLYLDLNGHLPSKDESLETLGALAGVWGSVADDIAKVGLQPN